MHGCVFSDISNSWVVSSVAFCLKIMTFRATPLSTNPSPQKILLTRSTVGGGVALMGQPQKLGNPDSCAETVEALAPVEMFY